MKHTQPATHGIPYTSFSQTHAALLELSHLLNDLRCCSGREPVLDVITKRRIEAIETLVSA